ncbi:GNAT family N-acetyltransferase [Helicobacter monodelphidis]|uniref:N-acetyltransferase n=1 Tax=Helicobacter sp. 15-1451 TaxID=2004995 RepID=UPI000DCD8FEE|nr:N-acetyltransferase [Helicobacter sp. 15-1451]RAX58876.1 GNAT family N-acetyltransferase [Helicobacter sp. 15-1451]
MQVLKPVLADIPQMQQLVLPEIQAGLILERSDDEVATAIRSYHIIKENQTIIGFCALHIYSSVLAEVRSLVVKEEFRGRGLSKQLIEAISKEAAELGIKEILSLTYRKSLFESLGFVEIQKTEIPNHKIWADCIKCKHFPICDEIALVKKL